MASGEIIGFKKNPSSLYLDNRKKNALKASQGVAMPCQLQVRIMKEELHEKEFPVRRECFQVTCVPEMPRRLLLCYSSYRGQAKLTSGCFSHSPKQEATGQAGSRPWHGSCEACVDMQSYKAMETSTHISTAGLEGQAACNGIGVLGDSS